ncbi:unnamed protein product [Parascedosporium putredinis]|uniref:Uncharacterized protein n=1 Tax=Parascedosporium putredinis TaxID=1442378 RepID=A0A9P1H5V1_9PEZI|nr:unnamed protein product [Parascedosporium putredinis]CAI7999661.1 unnamed protein product [Parascedosporium putredinis]
MSTPTSASKKKKKKTGLGRYGSTAGQSSEGGTAGFTDDMRDRQARGKDPYRVASDESEGEEVMRMPGEMSDRESFRVVEQRRMAAQILADPELLMMHALSRRDSIPGTRLHFTRILCGFAAPDEEQARYRTSNAKQA